MDIISVIILFVIILLGGLITILILIRKYLTRSSEQMYYRNQADIYQSTQAINTNQTLDEQQLGEDLHRDLPPKIVGTKKLKNIEKKKKKKQVRDAIIEIQKVKNLHQLHDRNEKAKEDLEIRANLDAEIRRSQGNLELRYKQLAEDIELMSEGCEGELNGTLLERFLSYTATNKLVVLDDLAAFIHLKSKTIALRLKRLVEIGRIEGVFDERGRFIQVTREELENLCSFIKMNGRVKTTELLAASNRIFKLK